MDQPTVATAKVEEQLTEKIGDTTSSLKLAVEPVDKIVEERVEERVRNAVVKRRK